MAQENETRDEQVRRYVRELYEDRDTVHQILQDLDRKWKLGHDTLADLDQLLHRFEAMAALFNYLNRTTSDRKDFFQELGLTDSEEAEFFDSLVARYKDLDDPLMELAFSRAGVQNHLLRFSPEGVFYDSANQIPLVQFSVYSERARLMQVRDHADDLVWLAALLTQEANKALQSCLDNKSVIAPSYGTVLKKRLERLDEPFQKYRELVGLLSQSVDKDSTTSSTEMIGDMESLERGSPVLPDVDLGVE